MLVEYASRYLCVRLIIADVSPVYLMYAYFVIMQVGLCRTLLTVCVMLGCIMMGLAVLFVMLHSLLVWIAYPQLYVYNVWIISLWSKASASAYLNSTR